MIPAMAGLGGFAGALIAAPLSSWWQVLGAAVGAFAGVVLASQERR